MNWSDMPPAQRSQAAKAIVGIFIILLIQGLHRVGAI